MKAYELLSDPSKWTKTVFARNKAGLSITPLQNDAVCWCVLGALYKCYPDFRERSLIRSKIEEAIGEEVDVPLWNDDPATTHKDVIELLRRVGA